MGHAPVETLGNGWCCIFALSESLRLHSPIELCEKTRALLLARELHNTRALKEPGADLGPFLPDGVKQNTRLCFHLDLELERKTNIHGVYSKLKKMVDKIRYHRARDEDPMMVFLTDEDAWQGDSLINLYAVWSGVEILVINMDTESKIQHWSSKGVLSALGYEPGETGRNAQPGSSFKPDLALYQVQWKFRDEVRPRFGVMRGREFLMKDGYNFDLTKEDALHAYNRHLVSYLRTYERMGLQAIPMRADSGPIGGDYTHEFLVLAETGESEVFYDSQVTDIRLGARDIDYDDVTQCQSVMEEFTSLYARTDETHDMAAFDALPEERRRSARGIEVGQIFYFGTIYSEKLGATVVNDQGAQVPVHMGSHGIGVSRLLGAIIEASHDDKGIIWPEGVTPYHCGIVNLKQGDEAADAACDGLYSALSNAGLEPLYDDRKERAGGKFATMDLIGLPWRITVGPRGLKNGVVEVTSRRSGESEEMTPEAAVAKVAAIYAAL